MSLPTATNAPKPSGRVPASGLALLLLVALTSALVVGWLYHFTARFFDLVIISSFVVGFLVGFPITLAARPARCRPSRPPSSA